MGEGIEESAAAADGEGEEGDVVVVVGVLGLRPLLGFPMGMGDDGGGEMVSRGVACGVVWGVV